MLKKYKKIISKLAIFAIMLTLSVFNFTSIKAAASYTLSSSFSSTQGQNQWYYMQWNGSSYSNMTWNGSWCWQGANTYNQIWSPSQIHPDANDSVVAWKASSAGSISISGNPRKAASGGDGVNVKIMKNGTQIWPTSGLQAIAGTDTTGISHNFNTTVVSNDYIYFIVNKNTNNSSDETTWNPTITYVDDSYTLSSGFSSTQGQNQWYYMQWNGSSYSNMTWDGSWCWQGANTYNQIWSPSQIHPDANDSVVAWKASSAGTISINGNARKTTSGGDGVNVKIIKNGTQIWPTSGWQAIAGTDTTGISHNFNTTVASNDYIYFIVNKNINNTSDETTWNPTITYADASGTYAALGTPQQLYTDSQLPFTFDQSFATLKKDSSNIYFYHFEAVNGSYGNMLRYYGPPSNPMQNRASDWTMDLNGKVPNGWRAWMPNIYKESANSYLGFIHLESDTFAGANCQYALGLAYSTDAINWKLCGKILAPQNPYQNVGGVPYLIKDGYLYVYFNDLTSGQSPYSSDIRYAVARSSLTDVMNAAKNYSVTTWNKYNNGSWNQDAFTGVGSNVLPDTPEVAYRDAHDDAAYCTTLGKYLITKQTCTYGYLYMYSSTDGVSWSLEGPPIDNAGCTPDSNPSYQQPYSTFVTFDSDDGYMVGSQFDLIYGRKNGRNYADDTMYKRTINMVSSVLFDSTKYYKIKNLTTGLVIDGQGSTTEGANLGLWSDVTHNNLQWQIVSLGKGYYKIKNRSTGLVVDGKGLSNDGANAGQRSDVTDRNLQWQIVDLGGGYFKFVSCSTGRVLDGRGLTTEGSLVGQWSDFTNNNLQWQIIEVN